MIPSAHVGPLDHATVTRRDALKYALGAAASAPLLGLLGACGGSDSAGDMSDTTEPASLPGSTALSGPARGGTAKLVMNNFSSADTLDPALNFYLSGLLANGVFYDTLVKTDNAWGRSPNLATEWSSSDDLATWTFRLRDGVEFHSGKVMTADDVVASLRRIVDPELGSIGYAILGPVLDGNGIVAVDATTVRFDLLQPDAFFVDRLASNYSRIHEADAAFEESAGTGPFRSVRFEPGVGFEAVRFENYWEDGLPYLDELNFVAAPDAATTVQAVLTGDADICDMAGFSLASQIESASNVSAIVDPFGMPYELSINGQTAPFDNPDVRRGLKMLIDRQQVVDIAMKGQAAVSADTYVNPADPFYPSDLLPVAHDPEQGKQLLGKAGVSGIGLEIATNTQGGLNDVALVLSEALNAGGVVSSVVQLTPGEYDKAIEAGSSHVGYWQRFHPALVLPYFYASDGIFNRGLFSDPSVDSKLGSLLGAADESSQKQIVSDILHTYNDGSATMWPVHANSFWPHQDRLQGAVTNPSEVIDFRRAFVQ